MVVPMPDYRREILVQVAGGPSAQDWRFAIMDVNGFTGHARVSEPLTRDQVARVLQARGEDQARIARRTALARELWDASTAMMT